MGDLKNRESRTRSCSCRRVKIETRMDQASGSRENSLPPLLCRKRVEKQRCRCRERPRGKGKQRLRGSSATVLPGVCFFNLLFKVRRPGIGHEQPHQQRGSDGKGTLIKESDRDETKNQVGAAPEPDVLMKHVEYNDRNNEQDVLHGGEKVSSGFSECQGPATKRHRMDFDPKISRCLVCFFVANYDSTLWRATLSRDWNRCGDA